MEHVDSINQNPENRWLQAYMSQVLTADLSLHVEVTIYLNVGDANSPRKILGNEYPVMKRFLLFERARQ